MEGLVITSISTLLSMSKATIRGICWRVISIWFHFIGFRLIFGFWVNSSANMVYHVNTEAYRYVKHIIWGNICIVSLYFILYFTVNRYFVWSFIFFVKENVSQLVLYIGEVCHAFKIRQLYAYKRRRYQHMFHITFFVWSHCCNVL